MSETKKQIPLFVRIMLGVAVVAGAGALILPAVVRRAGCGPSKNSCIANLKQIDGAIQQWALEHDVAETNAPVLTEALQYLKGGQLPVCPFGGSYEVGKTVADSPTCSRGKELGHTLP